MTDVLIHCRCGAKIRDGACPNENKNGEIFIYHDVFTQSFPEEMRNWIVIRRNGKFIPCAGGREGPEHFGTERAAWENLGALYHDEIVWEDDETTVYWPESVRLQEAAAMAEREGMAAEMKAAFDARLRS